jgi:hypothetical protein
MRVVRGGLRSTLTELTMTLRPLIAAAALIVAGAPALALAATPPPHATPPPGAIDVTKIQPKALLPKTALHTEFVVEVNKYGQVSRVRSGKACKVPSFNAQTYGNALQAFIRTPDGHAISGVYRLTYDYNPKTERVHRDVALLWAGGVNPNAQGAALQMMDIARKNRNRTPPPGSQPKASGPSAPPVKINGKRLPDLPQVMQSPSH